MLVAGGAQTTTEDTVEVRPPDGWDWAPPPIDWPGPEYWDDRGDYGGGGGGGDDSSQTSGDFDQISVDPRIVLDEQSRAALEILNEAIWNIKDLLKTAKGSDVMVMSDGSRVTIQEFKDIIDKTTWTINPKGTTYANGFATGESDFNNGSPRISINVDTVVGYAAMLGGGPFLALHELAHLTRAAQNNYSALRADGVYDASDFAQNERNTNDIARALGNYLGTSTLSPSDAAFIHGYSNNSYSFGPANGGSTGSGGNTGGGVPGGEQPPIFWENER